MLPTLHIHLLGDFLLVWDDIPLTTITVPRLQSLLAYLLLHRNAPQDRSHLAFLLWPDSTEAQAHTNLRKLLYQLRQAFPEIGRFLHVDKHSLQWLPATEDAPWTLDILEVEQGLALAEQAKRSQDISAMRQALEQVLHLYRGDLLPSCYDEWILPERDRLRLLFLHATERLIALLEQERDYDTAILVAQHLLRQDPLHEATYRQLMRFHALRGDRAAALRVYHTCATILERELRTEPSEVTRTAYEALMQPEGAINRGPTTHTGPLILRGAATPLLGRKSEWLQLQEAWRKGASGHPHIVILTGEAGIGKTRLAEEMEAWVSRQGMTTVSACCYATFGRLAYAPVTTWLRTEVLQTRISALDPIWLTEIGRLVPEMLVKYPKLPRPSAIEEGWQRQHFFEALARAVLSARQPLLLLLDDLQWCDNETLDWLHYLLRFEQRARLLLIGTVRAEETLPGHPLVAFLGALQRDGSVTEVPLGPLATEETVSLAEHIMGHQLDATMSNMLYSETEGNPLFVVERARAGTLGQCERAQPSIKSPPSLLRQSASTLPPTVQGVLMTRLAQLSPLAREVANVAAVIGREFTFAVLARASGYSGQSEDTVVQGLDELWQRRMVREQGVGTTDAYDFSHDKLREQVYNALSPAHQRLLHRRAAEAFEALYAGDLDTVSGQIATHYERAGLPSQAIPYYRRAGETALQVYANAEAITAFQRAVALLEAGSSKNVGEEQQWEITAQVYKSLGDIFLETGQLQEARQTYDRAIASIPQEEYLWQARLLHKMASTWNYISANPQDTIHVNAHQAFQEAERLLTHIADPSNPAWRHEWIELHFAQIWPLRRSADDMTETIEKVRPIVEQYGTQERRERLSLAIIMRDMIRTRYVISEQTISSLRTELASLQQTDNKSKIGISHLALGGALLWSSQLDEAEEQLEKALLVGEQLGIAWLQNRCLTFLSFISRLRGQVEQVRSILTRAEAIGAKQNSSVLMGQYAWVAWRDGNLAEAETYGRTSLKERQHQQLESNPFQWVGLWPLIGVALVQEKFTDVMDYVRLLLAPTQQPPPEPLGALLEATLRAWDAGQQQEARTVLQQAVPLAEQMGYL